MSKKLSIMFVLVLVFVLLVSWGKEEVYVDRVNGQTMTYRYYLGVQYRSSMLNTSYSRLIENYGLNSNEDWVLASRRNIGFRKHFFPRYECLYAGEYLWLMEVYSIHLKNLSMKEARREIEEFRNILRVDGDIAACGYMKTKLEVPKKGSPIRGSEEGVSPIN